jgi:hypothetical protein
MTQESRKTPFYQRPEDANKTPATRDKAIHRIADNKVGVPAEINAIVPVQQAAKDHWTQSL